MNIVRHAACALLVMAAMAGTSASALPTPPVPVPYQILTDADFQVFLGNWDGSGPLCAALAGQADWDRYMHPAPVMGPQHRLFQPAASFWRGHVALLIGRVATAGTGGNPSLRIEGVTRQGGALTRRTHFQQVAGGTFEMKLWALVVLPRPLPPSVTFRDADGTSCVVPRHP
jgi:hypothetical protein